MSAERNRASAYEHFDGAACANPALCDQRHRRATPRSRPHAGMPDGWRDVPMPDRVAALPRTSSGVPITYTVAWSSENSVEIRPDSDLAPLMGYAPPAIYSSGRPGEGTPKLAIVDTSRARRATVRGLCQICGRHLPGRPRQPWDTEPRWCGWFTKGQTIRYGGRFLPLIIDGWTCGHCLAYSLQVCPTLVARRAAGTLQLLRIRRAELVAVRERPDSIPLSALDEVPVGMVKIAPVDFDVFTPKEALAALGGEPSPAGPQLEPVERPQSSAEGVTEYHSLPFEFTENLGIRGTECADDRNQAGTATVLQIDCPPVAVGARGGGVSAVDARDGHASGSCSRAGQNGRS